MHVVADLTIIWVDIQKLTMSAPMAYGVFPNVGHVFEMKIFRPVRFFESLSNNAYAA